MIVRCFVVTCCLDTIGSKLYYLVTGAVLDYVGNKVDWVLFEFLMMVIKGSIR